jgi:hypothetical protein
MEEMTEHKVVEARERPRERGGLVWPILLIAVGILFLLDNMNVISFDFWYAAFRLWPIVLIAIGLDLLIGRRSLLASFFIALVTVAMLVAGFFWLGAGGGRGNLVSETVSQPLSGAEAAQVTIGFGVGELNLEALPAGSDELIAGDINRPERGMRVEQAFEMEGDTAVYSLQMEGSGAPRFFDFSPDDWRWDLQLSPDVPLDLNVSTGVGESNIDLRQLNLSNLDVDTGVGQTTVILPGEGQLDVTIDGGVGEVIVELPEGVAARIESDTGLGDTNIEGDYERDGDAYVTAGYDDALDRIDLKLSAGVGQVTVRTYSGR